MNPAPLKSQFDHLDKIQPILLAWYAENKRDLPWRKSRDPYHIWVSEVMLQQTQVKTVLPYYKNFLSHFGQLADLAAAHQQAVLKCWEGLGYYARARNLHRSAKILCEHNACAIPSDWHHLRKLPGVGDYIAAAVLSIAFNKPYAVVDGNVKRVVARMFRCDWAVNDAALYNRFKKIADQLLDKKQPGEFNQAVMELGALICTPRKPYCNGCPINRHCQAFKANAINNYPVRLKRKEVPERHLVAGIIFKNKKVLIARRPSEGLLGGMWEFPSVEISPGQNTACACVAAMKNLVNQTVSVQSHLTTVHHRYTHFKLKLDVFICTHLYGRIHLKGPADFKWVKPHEIEHFPIHKANLKIMPALKKYITNA
jgi:A/G-specific adenine glycosylase